MLLQTERLILREFEPGDWPDVLAYQSDPLYLRYYPSDSPTPDGVRAFVRMFVDWRREQPRTRFQLAVVLRSEQRLIGTCGIRVNDTQLREANIGYELDSRCWNRGYATEAARAIVAFGFETLRLHRIWSWCVAENAGSARVLEKVGMRREGCLREKEYFKGRWHDHLLYGILDRAWQDPKGSQS